jgi:hypothetical protein
MLYIHNSSLPTPVVSHAHRCEVFRRIAENLHSDRKLRLQVLADETVPRQYGQAYGFPAGYVYELDACYDFPGLLNALRCDGFWSSGCLHDSTSLRGAQIMEQFMLRTEVERLHALVECSFKVAMEATVS